MSHTDDDCAQILRKLLDCLDRPLHPYLTAAIGTAIVAMSYIDGSDEDDNEDILLQSCENLLGYTMSFAERMKSQECETLRAASEEIASVIFGPERTRSAIRIVKEECVIIEMEGSRTLN